MIFSQNAELQTAIAFSVRLRLRCRFRRWKALALSFRTVFSASKTASYRRSYGPIKFGPFLPYKKITSKKIHDFFTSQKKSDTYHKRGGKWLAHPISYEFRRYDFQDGCISSDFENNTDRFASSRAFNPFFKRLKRLRIAFFTVVSS